MCWSVIYEDVLATFAAEGSSITRSLLVTICCCIARYPGRPIAVARPPDRGCNQGTVEEWKEELVTSPHCVHVRPHRNPPRVGFGVRPGRCARGGRTGNLDFKTDCSLSEV